MNNVASLVTETTFDLGTFEGFNFREQSAIFPNLTVEEVLTWDHDEKGEAEFWPAGDRPEMLLIHKGSTITALDITETIRLLEDLGGDSTENFLLLHYALHICGSNLEELTRDDIRDYGIQLFLGNNLTDVRREAAYELFENYYPEEYAVWEKSTCDGLDFDCDHFLDSPAMETVEVRVGNKVALLVRPQ